MLNYILLQAADTAPKPQGSSWSFLIMMILIFLVFYLFMIRPQTKRQKELQKQRDSLKKGDKVITAGGIYGEIKDILENAFIITVSKDVTIKVDKSSVTPLAEPEPKKTDPKAADPKETEPKGKK